MTPKKTGGKSKFSIVRPAVLIKTFSSRSVKFVKLQKINAGLAGLYLVQAVVLLVLGHGAKAPIMLNYLAADPLQSAAQHKTVLTLAAHHWFDANLLAMVVTALLLAAVVHAALATVLRTRYEDALTKKLHDVRWFGCALIGGLVLVTLALVLGVADVALLLALFGLCVLLALGAMAIEANQRLWPWALFAKVAAVAVVLALAAYVWGGVIYGMALPMYAYLALAITLLGMAAMAVNLWLQISGKDQWKDYVFVEMVYAGLSAVVLSAFAWVVFAGALRG